MNQSPGQSASATIRQCHKRRKSSDPRLTIKPQHQATTINVDSRTAISVPAALISADIDAIIQGLETNLNFTRSLRAKYNREAMSQVASIDSPGVGLSHNSAQRDHEARVTCHCGSEMAKSSLKNHVKPEKKICGHLLRYDIVCGLCQSTQLFPTIQLWVEHVLTQAHVNCHTYKKDFMLKTYLRSGRYIESWRKLCDTAKQQEQYMIWDPKDMDHFIMRFETCSEDSREIDRVVALCWGARIATDSINDVGMVGADAGRRKVHSVAGEDEIVGTGQTQYRGLDQHAPPSKKSFAKLAVIHESEVKKHDADGDLFFDNETFGAADGTPTPSNPSALSQEIQDGQAEAELDGIWHKKESNPAHPSSTLDEMTGSSAIAAVWNTSIVNQHPGVILHDLAHGSELLPRSGTMLTADMTAASQMAFVAAVPSFMPIVDVSQPLITLSNLGQADSHGLSGSTQWENISMKQDHNILGDGQSFDWSFAVSQDRTLTEQPSLGTDCMMTGTNLSDDISPSLPIDVPQRRTYQQYPQLDMNSGSSGTVSCSSLDLREKDQSVQESSHMQNVLQSIAHKPSMSFYYQDHGHPAMLPFGQPNGSQLESDQYITEGVHQLSQTQRYRHTPRQFQYQVSVKPQHGYQMQQASLNSVHQGSKLNQANM